MLADLANLPPLYIVACEFDPLLNDFPNAPDGAGHLHGHASGTPRVWQGMVHAAVA